MITNDLYCTDCKYLRPCPCEMKFIACDLCGTPVQVEMVVDLAYCHTCLVGLGLAMEEEWTSEELDDNVADWDRDEICPVCGYPMVDECHNCED